MRKRIWWILHEIRWLIIKIVHKLTGYYMISDEKYGKLDVLSALEGNDFLYNKIKLGEPFSFCRFGYVELDLMIRCERDRLFFTNSFIFKNVLKNTFLIKGQNKIKGIYKFDKLMKKACDNADAFGVWKNLGMGDFYLNTLQNITEKKIVFAQCLDAYLYEKPWSYALEGKKVLVVTPFSKTIQKQYNKNRNMLFENKKILPEFELYTLDAIWYSAAGKDERFNNWFEAYEYLCEECKKIDFDIALLGCGPFGFPLACEIKMLGKQAIHVGGALQLLFGVSGKRWDEGEAGKLYNKYWTRPPKETMPNQAKILDDQCYW